MKTPNWKHMIEVLVANGYKQSAIAKACGVSNSTITELKQGILKNMYWQNGQVLIQMFIEVEPI